MSVKKAIIPAAGLGTRFLPATKAQPKEMLPIVDKPTIQYIVEEAIASGIESIMIVTGKNKRAIEDHFDKSPELEWQLQKKEKWDLYYSIKELSNLVDIHTVRQKEPLGLGHAILCAKHFVQNEPFAVLLGDDLIVSQSPGLSQLIKAFHEEQCPVIGVQKVSWDQVNRYGIIRMLEKRSTTKLQIKDMVEKPAIENAPSNLAIVGRYVLTPDIFPILEKTPTGIGNEIQLTDALRVLCQNTSVFACQIQGNRYDVGEPMGYIQAIIEFALQRKDLYPQLKQYLLSLTETIKGIG
ncbi:UTP--glucose-1-phosphate uridylyltransferase GalU [Risungbinella massiliensis]|uniref:UTP--glucose-1-phosphate uridylyltransferase GalU n=1 Tax=Risungbinella massiliensis TaxID=1329796 RepID=UPI0005CC2CEE|nr:UTP--glucose-1-phosphate uridylyltransferase GalU [Risungbinella massiliensis]